MTLATILRFVNMGSGGAWAHRWYIMDDYFKLAAKYGVGMAAVMDDHDLESLCGSCDGLFVPGSATNIDPRYYGMPPFETPEPVDEYAMDARLIRFFLERGKPIFGICGGHQALNVFFGGTLKKLDDPVNHKSGEVPSHVIDITPGSFVHDVFGTESATVNSYHNWEIGRLAPCLTVAARTRDGVIEAVECREKHVYATQWHPEQSFHTGDVIEHKFFENFLAECGACRG